MIEGEIRISGFDYWVANAVTIHHKEVKVLVVKDKTTGLQVHLIAPAEQLEAMGRKISGDIIVPAKVLPTTH